MVHQARIDAVVMFVGVADISFYERAVSRGVGLASGAGRDPIRTDSPRARGLTHVQADPVIPLACRRRRPAGLLRLMLLAFEES